VFNDAKQRTVLNGIIHPILLRRIADGLERLRATDEIVVLDAALLVETGLDRDMDVVVVVVADQSIREQRLVASRGMSRADVQARISAQASEEDLVAKAGMVIRNDDDLEALTAEADRVWAHLQVLRQAK
jgi:dephospho-CoA kinase